MATKQKTVSRVSDLPIINKIWDGMQTVVAHNKQNYVIDVSNITGRTILGMTELESDKSGDKNIIYINFNDRKTDKLYVYNGTDGNQGEPGKEGETGNQGEEGYINPNGRGITGTMYIVNNSVTEDPNLPWSAYRGKDMNDKIYEMNETFVSEDEFNLLFNDVKYIYAEFVTKEDNQTANIFNNDKNPHIVYKKYWTFEDDGGKTYYIWNPNAGKDGSYEPVVVDLWKDIYLGDTEGYFPITSSMSTDGTQVFYFDKSTGEYKEVELIEVPRQSGSEIIMKYNGDKHIDNYYIPELDASLTADYKVSNNRWTFELIATSNVVPDVYTTEDEVHFTKMSKADVLAIDTTVYAQYYQKNGDKYELIQNIASYLATKAVRYYKRNVTETASGSYDETDNGLFCEVPLSEIDMDSLTDDFIILTYTKTTNTYEFERHYPGTLYGEPIQIVETITINTIDLYYHTTDRIYYENVLTDDETGGIISTYIPIQIPSWIYAEFKTYDEDVLSLILNANENTQGQSENNYIEDDTQESLDDTVLVDRIFRIVPGDKKEVFMKTADDRYVAIDLSKDSIYATAEYYIFDGEYIKLENPEEYLTHYDMTIFTGEPQLLPITIYPGTTRSYVTVEYDPEKIKFYENGRIAATIGDDFTTQIIISSENSNAKAYVNVRVTTPVKKIEFKTSNPNYVDYGNSAILEYTVEPETADNKEINWIFDETKVTVEPIEFGKIQVEGIGIGTLNITAEAADSFGAKATASFEVVRPAESVSWPDASNIIYHPTEYYSDSEIREYNMLNADAIANGELEALTAETVKTPAYYSMVALLYKEYALAPVVSPADTSYPEIIWSSSNPTIASVYNKNVKIIDVEGVKRLATQTDVDENIKDADGNPITEEMIGTEVTFVKEVSHNAIQYTLTSSKIGEVTITGSLDRYRDLKVAIDVRIDQSIEEIVISPANLSMNINTKKKLTAEILPETAVNGTISWHSLDDSIVSISNTGTVTARNLGSTTIIAHAEDGSEVDGRCTVTVTAPAKDINLRADTVNGIIYLGIGNTTNISANILYDETYANGTKLGINWVSTNPEIASIVDKSSGTDYKAEITGVALGKTTIIANAKDGSGVLGSIQIEVIKLVESVSFDFDSIEMEVSDSLVLIPRFEPADASNEIVVWQSSDETIAKVKESGIVYALQPGTATITATTTDGTDLTATCTVTIS